MGRDNPGLLGFVSNSGGSSSKVSEQSSSVGGSTVFISHVQPREGSFDVGRGSDIVTQGGYRDCSQPFGNSRFLFSPFFGSEENRWNAPSFRSFDLEYLSCYSALQDGNQSFNQGLYQPWYVDYQSRPYRCLFPCSHSYSIQEVPSFCMGRDSLSVSSAPVWHLGRSSDLHQNFSNSSCPSSYSVYPDSLIPGRFSDQEFLSSRFGFPNQGSHPSVSEVGISSVMEEVRTSSFSRFSVSRGTLQNTSGTCFTSGGKVSVSYPENCSFSEIQVCDSQAIFSTSGFSKFSGRCGSLGSSIYTASSVLSPSALGSCLSGLGSSSSYSPHFNASPSLVVSAGECSEGSVSVSSSSFPHSLHRRKPTRLGSLSGRRVHFGSVVSYSTAGTHQPLRVESSSLGSISLSGPSSSKDSGGRHRQHYSSGLPPESGRNSQSQSVLALQGSSSSLFREPDSVSSTSHSRSPQCASRRTKPFTSTSEHGVGITASDFRHNHSPLGSSSLRPVCHSSESQTGHLCFSSSRPSGIRSRRYVSILGGNVRLRFPSVQIPVSSSSEDSSGIMQDHSYCTSLAQTSLVLRSSASVVCQSPSTSSQNRPTVAVQRKSLASSSGESSSARLATLREGLRQKGFSSGASRHISKAVRQSTEKVYDAKWGIFCHWCAERKIDPIKISVQQLADFLVFLFEVKELSPSTIKGYKSAISRTISISGGPDFSNNEHLSLLARNFDLERPRQKRLVPQWDLSLVLSALKLSPFEPISEADLKFVAYKCCFLIALASGRRRSEIHALSVSESCLRFSRDESSVTLLTDPSFLGKNQIPDKGAVPIVIPALPSDSPDLLLCPVRTLKVYLNRTKELRSASNSRLFLPVKKGVSDLSAKSISRWICNTIFMAYKSSGDETLPRHSVKAHEVRAISSSWALFNSASISEVLMAGYWRCQNSFTEHYLRSLASFADNLFSLGPIVAAQRINFTPATSS